MEENLKTLRAIRDELQEFTSNFRDDSKVWEKLGDADMILSEVEHLIDE